MVVVCLVTAALGAYWWLTSDLNEAYMGSVEFPESVIPPSDYANTSLDVGYVGSQRCRDCHSEQFDSWAPSAHAHALSEVNLESAPPAGVVEHSESGRRYEIYHRGGQMYHKELMRLADGSERVLLDLPVKYVIGSGRFSQSYLIERDEFLMESPVTWYHETQRWGMSPGYDNPMQVSFQRGVNLDCVQCHSGVIESSQESNFVYHFQEMAVSCERCHGAGELHAKNGALQSADGKSLIVQPTQLSRRLQESLCGDCHLGASIQVPARNRQLHEFRPGLPLESFRHDYLLVAEHKSQEEMTVTGHVLQMRRSRCWQESDSFTCTTCHNPHDTRLEAERLSGYRKICLDCHECGESEVIRLQTEANDNCVVCHMPATPTEIPHFSFTHHRVGVYREPLHPPADSIPSQGVLEPVADWNALESVEQRYSLAKAYLDLALQYGTRHDTAYYQNLGRRMILDLAEEGYLDATIGSVVSRMNLEQQNFARAEELAHQFLGDETLPPKLKSEFHGILAECAIQSGQFAEAIEPLKQLTRVRYDPSDWLNLAVCYQQTGQLPSAVKAVEKSLEINPAPGAVHIFASQLYEAVGETEKARVHQQLGKLLPLHGYEGLNDPSPR